MSQDRPPVPPPRETPAQAWQRPAALAAPKPRINATFKWVLIAGGACALWIATCATVATGPAKVANARASEPAPATESPVARPQNPSESPVPYQERDLGCIRTVAMDGDANRQCNIIVAANPTKEQLLALAHFLAAYNPVPQYDVWDDEACYKMNAEFIDKERKNPKLRWSPALAKCQPKHLVMATNRIHKMPDLTPWFYQVQLLRDAAGETFKL